MAGLLRQINVGRAALPSRSEWPLRAEHFAADIDTTAVRGAGDLHPETIGFETAPVLVMLEADVPPATLEALVGHATQWSPVADTLHNPVHLDVVLAPAR